MSEKRFQLDIGDDYCFINDKIEDRTYAIYNDRFKERWSQEIVDLLNKQDEKIKKLHRDIHISDELDKEKLEALKDAETKIQLLEKVNEDLREVNKENQLLHEENVKQCERWKNLYELKDAEVTARVDTLNKVCEYYTSKVLFKSDVDPNKAVKEVINEILNTEVEM